MTSRRTAAPTYGTKGYRAPTQKHRTTKYTPVFSFYPSTYAIEINPQDETLKLGLRRKSFTGETPHPILRQLSDGRVHIPVEHIDENDVKQSGPIAEKTVHTEYAELSNNARKQNKAPTKLNTQAKKVYNPRTELRRPLEDDEKTKTEEPENVYGNISYDPQNYEEQWSLNKNPPLYGVASSENLRWRCSPANENLQKDFRVESKDEMEDDFGKLTLREEYEAEIKKQDKFMKDQYKLHRFHIIPDGNCLYRAVAQAVLLNQSQHKVLRQLAVEHIQENKDEFKEIIEGDVDEFLIAAKLEGEWAGYPEILALSRLLDININITTGGTSTNPNVHLRLHYFEPSEKKDETNNQNVMKKEDFTQRKSIWLSWLSSGHYDTFTEKVMDNPSYEEWHLSRESRLQTDAAMANQLYTDDVKSKRQHHYENANLHYRSDDIASHKIASSRENSTISPVLSSYQNQETHNLYGANINEVLYDDLSNSDAIYDYDLESAVPQHKYPPPTYIEESPKSTRVEREPPHSSTLSDTTHTECDEFLARSLQNEEIERDARSLVNYYISPNL